MGTKKILVIGTDHAETARMIRELTALKDQEIAIITCDPTVLSKNLHQEMPLPPKLDIPRLHCTKGKSKTPRSNIGQRKKRGRRWTNR